MDRNAFLRSMKKTGCLSGTMLFIHQGKIDHKNQLRQSMFFLAAAEAAEQAKQEEP